MQAVLNNCRVFVGQGLTASEKQRVRRYPPVFDTPVECLWTALGTPVERLWNAWGTPVERLCNARGTPVERLWKACRARAERSEASPRPTRGA